MEEEAVRDKLLHKAEIMCFKNKERCQMKENKKIYALTINSIHRDRNYLLTKIDSETDTGICCCGVVTSIIDEPFYCKYCGQKLSAKFGWSFSDYYNQKGERK